MTEVNMEANRLTVRQTRSHAFLALEEAALPLLSQGLLP